MKPAIKKISVIGPGMMGHAIAQEFAAAGYDVILCGRSEDRLEQALEKIEHSLKELAQWEMISENEVAPALQRLQTTTDLKAAGSGADLILESVVEVLEVKEKLFSELDTICSRHAVLTTNTSSQSIIDIAMTTKRPDKVLGLHFFNPAPAIKLLEVVKSIATSDEILEIGKEFGRSLGKSVVVAPDRPGFLVNSLMSPWRLNAIRMLEARIATREDIDTAIKLGANMPMGPLEVADLIGLDTILEGASTMYREYNDPKYAPPLLLKKMVAAGWLGRKTGKGFYEY